MESEMKMGVAVPWKKPCPFYWKRYSSSQMGMSILKCRHSLRSSLILITTYQGFHMSFHLHMYSTLKDEKILKIIRNLGLKSCLCRSICPPVYQLFFMSAVCLQLPAVVSQLSVDGVQLSADYWQMFVYNFLPRKACNNNLTNKTLLDFVFDTRPYCLSSQA